MSAVNNNSKAMQVLGNAYLGPHLFSFMSVDALERLKRVSKRIPQKTVDEIVHERVYKALAVIKPPMDQYYLAALRNFTLRNFQGEVPRPLYGHGMTNMVGFQNVLSGSPAKPNVQVLYVLTSRHNVSRSCCLPDWHHAKEFALAGYHHDTTTQSTRRLMMVGIPENEPGVAKRVCFECCCPKCCYPSTENIFSWEEAAKAARAKVTVRARGPAPQIMN